MKILGIETATRLGSVAIVEGGSVIAEQTLPDGRSHSSSLIPVLDAVLKEEGIGIDELGGIVVGIGPGSFTGIRMGLATARGLAAALDIPLRGLSSFDSIIAGDEGGADRFCPVVNAHSYGLYAALYERVGEDLRCVRDPFVCQPAELVGQVEGSVFFLGPDLGRFRETLQNLFAGRASFDDEDAFPRAAFAARLFASPRAVRDDEPPGIAPLYVLPGVKRKSRGRRDR